MKKNKLIWNVLLHDFNVDKIEDYNVFDHMGFRKDLKKVNKQCPDDEDFFNKVLPMLRYYFWAKCEYEVLVSGLFDGNKSAKIDAFGQIVANEAAFKEYLLSHRKDI